MTTEEKIEEIGTYRPINFISESDLCAYQQGLERGAREMAEWKEQQVIEKTINFFNDNHYVNCGWIDDVEIDKFADEYVKYMKGEN